MSSVAKPIEDAIDILQLLEDSDEIDVDFIEIGTSNFDTLLQTAKPNEIGISVEPILHYLTSLPDKKNVLKVNTAITSNRTADSIDIYYIPEDVIDTNGIDYWFKGCNSVNSYHPLHIRYNLQKFVRINKSKLVNIEDFLREYRVRGIKYLKIDTEGHDIVILNGLFDYLESEPKKSKKYYPKKILFESNFITPKEKVDAIIERSRVFGYKLVSRDNSDTRLELE
jgi:hypothetical protein